MHFDWERGAFTIEGAAGQTDLIPEFRDYTVELCGVKEAVPKVYISGKEIKITYEYQWKKGCIRIHIPKVSVDEKVEIVFEQKLTLNDNHTLGRTCRSRGIFCRSFQSDHRMFYGTCKRCICNCFPVLWCKG